MLIPIIIVISILHSPRAQRSVALVRPSRIQHYLPTGSPSSTSVSNYKSGDEHPKSRSDYTLSWYTQTLSSLGPGPVLGNSNCATQSHNGVCVPEVANSESPRGPVRDQGSLNASALLPRPLARGHRVPALLGTSAPGSHPRHPRPGRPRRFFAPAPGTPTGPARRPRRPGLAEPRSRTAAGRGQQRQRRRARRGAEGRGAGLGLPPAAALPAARDPAPPFLPRRSPPRPPAPLPPRRGATAALGLPQAAPPSSSSSSPKGGRAAAAQAGAEPHRSPGRPRPRHSPVGGASGWGGAPEGGAVAAGARGPAPFPELTPGQFSILGGSLRRLDPSSALLWTPKPP